MNPITTPRGLSLVLAVVHHGLSCLAEGAIPAKAGTVLQTAKLFEDHLLLDKSV